jgi:pilus assembly protein CpaC
MGRRPKFADPPRGGATGGRWAGWRHFALGAAAAIVLAAATVTASAAPASTVSSQQQGVITIEVGKAQLVRLPEPAATVFIADPAIADVQVPNARSFLVFGKKAGFTTAYAVMHDGKSLGYTVTVERPVEELAAELRRVVPGATVTAASTPAGIVVSGHVATPRDAERLRATARTFIGDKESLIFDVTVDTATQVNLQVRVAEVSRTAAKNFGFNWGAIFNNGTIAIGLLTGRAPASAFGAFNRDTSLNNLDSLGAGYHSSSFNIATLIDALQDQGLITVLAEPNLTAISGETANFLAGGEFPIPIAQGNQEISIEFKQFGVSVDFTPTVLDGNRISIKVRPEVSELTSVGAVTINGITVPALAVRRADTTVEMASGQSFAIAGLFQNNVTSDVKQFPGLGDIPILGTLFRSTSFQRNESELVIIVTPYIVRPAATTAALHLPTEGLAFSSDLQQILTGRQTSTARPGAAPNPGEANPPHLSGPAGFLLEK